jgi:hypothetical protein
MIKDICSKLNSSLTNGDFGEPSVTYIFVEIRKLLEKEKTDERFSLVHFYSDWVVHSELQGEYAYQHLRIMEELFLEKTTLYIDIPIIDKMKSFISFVELKQQLRTFLDAHGLPTIVLNEQSLWNKFLDSLINILSDSPLKMRDNKALIKEFRFKPQMTAEDVIFEVALTNGIVYSGTTNFTYLANN